MNATRIIPFTVLMILLSPAAFSQALPYKPPPPRIYSMKLLTPETGWAVVERKLFWITRGGANWKDITPALKHKRQAVSSVFFLNPATGWVVLSCRDDLDPKADDVCFEIASTTTAGKTWSVVHPRIVDSGDIEDGQGLSETTFLNFAEPTARLGCHSPEFAGGT